MSKIVSLKLKKAGSKVGPFSITTEWGDILGVDVSKKTLIKGISYTVDDRVEMITLTSTGKCAFKKTFSINEVSIYDYSEIKYEQTTTAYLWRHLTDVTKYNNYYNNIEPYILEYPFATSPNTEILQNIQDYSKVYKYFSSNYDVNRKIETNNEYFNKMIIYNDQQSSGVLELIAKPLNNLSAYLKYPLYNTDSKTILYTKSDNVYKINTFWDIVKNKSEPIFLSSCKSMSIDKEVNQENMIYTNRSFKKYPLRAKDVKIRYVLDNKSDIHIVSQFVLTSNQISYK